MANTELKSDNLFEMMKIHLATDAGKEITKKIDLVYQFNIAPKVHPFCLTSILFESLLLILGFIYDLQKIGVDEVSYIVDLKKGEVTKG